MSTHLSHLTASAVVLAAGAGRTFLVRVGEYSRWGLVGSHVDSGEPLAEAVRREVREQTGLTRFRVVEPHLAVQQDLVDCGHGESLHVDHVFAVLADAPSGTDYETAGWFALDELPEPLVPGVRMHIRSAVHAVFDEQ